MPFGAGAADPRPVQGPVGQQLGLDQPPARPSTELLPPAEGRPQVVQGRLSLRSIVGFAAVGAPRSPRFAPLILIWG
jgi:hypothetical protein